MKAVASADARVDRMVPFAGTLSNNVLRTDRYTLSLCAWSCEKVLREDSTWMSITVPGSGAMLQRSPVEVDARSAQL